MQELHIVEVNKGFIIKYNHMIPVIIGQVIYVEGEADTFEYTVLSQSTRFNIAQNKVITKVIVEEVQ